MSRLPRTAKTSALKAFTCQVADNADDFEDDENNYPLPLRERIEIGRGIIRHLQNSSPPASSSSQPGGDGIGRGILAIRKTMRALPPSVLHPGGGDIPSLRQPTLQPRSDKVQLLEKLVTLPESCSGSEGSSCSESPTESSSDSESSSNFSEDTSDSGEETSEIGYVGKDGTEWTEVRRESGGRLASQNIFRAKQGLTHYCRNVVEPIDALHLFLDEGLLRHIRDCTVEFGRTKSESFSVSVQELEAFFGLLYLRGAMSKAHFPYDLLWSNDYGCEKFKRAMSRDRFREIKKCLRFDERFSRSQRVQTDKFALISSVHDRMVENFQRAYMPKENLTIDEQLFPTKARCRFLQYMSNKPDKFGIKFWVLAEVESKYCLNLIPYLGKDETRVAGVGSHVVTSLMAPYLNKGYNVCTDNFFTSHQLAESLLQRSTSIVGTVRANRRELPAAALSRMALHESKFFHSDQVNLVSYQAKKLKTVHVISTLHRGISCSQDEKKKPDAIQFYNRNKCGVDLLDSMCKAMTTKIGTRRWPFAVFCNLLDMAAINAWIVFKQKTSINITRRKFLFQLAAQLTEENAVSRSSSFQPSASLVLDKRTTCRVRLNCERNRTLLSCSECKMPMCGQCQIKVCMKCSSAAP